MTTLPEFLLARIAEDEVAAHAAAKEGGASWATDQWGTDIHRVPVIDNSQIAVGCWDGDIGDAAQHIARHDPARVLAECEAKRRIVERLSAGMPDEDVMDGYEADGWEQATKVALHLLALPYATHPDYNPAWKV